MGQARNGPWQGQVFSQIKDRRYYKDKSCPRNARGSVILTLVCGHESVCKASKEPLMKAYCRDCTLRRQQQERDRLQRAGSGS